MATKEQTIHLLQQILSGLLAGAQMHYLHAQINRQQGFHKLADRMHQEYQEEMQAVNDFLLHINRLGGSVQVSPSPLEIHHEVYKQLSEEYKLQQEGVANLEHLIQQTELDLVTENFLQDYLDEESEHEAWLKQQLTLIDQIGLPNYLTKQI